MTLIEANKVWASTLNELSMQLPRATFDARLRNTTIIADNDDTWSVLCQHQHDVAWLDMRLRPVVERTFQRRQPGITLAFVTLPDGNGNGHNHTEPDPEPEPCPEPDQNIPAIDPDQVLAVAEFDPATAGWWQAGHYATWYWAALLGPIAWRVYELIVAEDKRRVKGDWTPPRRYSVSELARAIAAGRDGRPNRNQIRGRWRTNRETGERTWHPGAFDALTEHNVGHVEWHDGSLTWRPWICGGFERKGRAGLRVVYRLSVVTALPLLTPAQVAILTSEHQVSHERYLVERGIDLEAWEAIPIPTLAGGTNVQNFTQLVPTHH